mmetsp:Transcript_127507/g.354979  ORF Transcript_127507/g.354979 Transcript_127507/m.354979 type:complete len:111 (-) Transcript_127507:60-392(-)|eukprot:CAMPEP_0179088502 /NCGR_PEP_ID=MMETSP0796-20121207/40272_1 /TAXON_ID=73915 /ORGANISM="Pyrodinium bahamense, Strain pbaha01" /LENGTH=110 /DNA_ID=CAMNT_0020786033 /DNA_START=36 /DNA_END=368 /DNA_ORIENTATION=-
MASSQMDAQTKWAGVVAAARQRAAETETSQQTAAEQISDAFHEILKVFRLFDDDETGKTSWKNLKRVAEELGERMTDEELRDMIDEADRDGDGEVNEEEFLRIMKKTNLF